MNAGERVADEAILQVGDAFALECLPPRRSSDEQVVGFVGARKSSHSCFVDFVPVDVDARTDSGSGRPPNPELSRFTLCTPNQYIASKTLRAFEEWSTGNFAEGEQLKLAAEKETSSNAAVMRSSRGQPALFGNVFQLQHPAGHYLDLNKQMATEEPAALRCGLATPNERTKHTWFRFLPGFRTRKEGEPIRMGDTVIIQSMKKSSKLYLHVGRDETDETDKFTPALAQTRAELNLCTPMGGMEAADKRSTWRTQFRIVPVAKFNTVEKSQGDDLVRGGDYVEIFHRQSQGYLAVDRRHHRRRCRLFRPIPDSNEADPMSTIASELVWKLMSPSMAWSGSKVTVDARDDDVRSTRAVCLNAANHCGEDLFLAEGEDGHLELVLNADLPAAQWHLQPFDAIDGSFRYDLSKFFLVNAETGNVLHQGKEDEEKDAGGGEGHAWFGLQAIAATIEHEMDVFVLHSVASTSENTAWLSDFQTAEEGLDGLWEFHAEMEKILGSNVQATSDTRVLPPSPKGKKATGRKKKRKKHKDAAFWQLGQGPSPLPHSNLHLGLDLDRDHLPPPPKVRRLATACVSPPPLAELCLVRAPVETLLVWQDTRTKEERTEDLLSKYVSPPTHHWDDWAGPVLNDLRIFIGNLTTGVGDNPLFWDGIVSVQQQQILSGLGMIPFLVHMLQSLFQLFPPEKITVKDYPHLLLVVQGTFHLLKCLVKGSLNRNAFQLYRHHDWLAEMAQHTHFRVVHCITEMFNNTPELLHNAQLVVFIDEFWALAVQTRRSRFLNFLRDISYDNLSRPLDSNQEDVVSAIREHLPDDLFQEKPREEAIAVHTDKNHNDKVAQDYRFSLALVELAAAVCDGRMQEGLRLFLQDVPMFGFTYKNILTKINDANATIAGYAPNDPNDIRRVYLKAMRAMYVDRQYSGIEKQTRQRTRIWEGIDKSNLVTRSQANRTQSAAPEAIGMDSVTPDFVDLKEALYTILVDCAGGIDGSETRRNLMLLEALGLMQYIIRQGYYDPRSRNGVDDGVLLLGDELKDLLKYLIRLMDGRDDTGFLDARRRRELDWWEVDELSKPGSVVRFEVNQQNRIVFQIKTKTLEIVNDLLDIKSSSRVDDCMKALAKAKQNSSKGMLQSLTSRNRGLTSDTQVPETVNPLADLGTFEIEDSSQTSFEIEGAVADDQAVPADDDDDEECDDGGVDDGFDKKTRAIASTALKSDQSSMKSGSLFADPQDGGRLAEILLDNLRYTEDEALVLSSFTALHHYKGENERFYELLSQITLVTSPEDASLFLILYNLMSNFRQSIVRLLETSFAEQCVSSCKAMAVHCIASPTARSLLRNIGIGTFVSELLLTHPNNIHPNFLTTIISNCLKLVIALCHNTDQLSQELFADRVETVFLPLLRGGPTDVDPPLQAKEREQIMKLTARTITHFFVGNRGLSVSYSAIVTQAVVEQARVFGKNLDLLRMLKTLIEVDGKSVEQSQTNVSKHFVEKAGGLDGRIMVDEWGLGPSRDFKHVVEDALKNPSADGAEPTRAEMAMEYTCLLTEIVGKCARGLMPHTELRAASMLTFDQCVSRLLMLYQLPALAQFQYDDKFISVKSCVLLFLNDVFIDSDSEFTQAVVQQRMNGLWSMSPRHAESRSGMRYNPLGQVLVTDMNRLRRSSTAVFCDYVIQEVIDFFVLYCVSTPRIELAEADDELVTEGERLEAQAKAEFIGEAGLACQQLVKRMGDGPQGLSEQQLLSCKHMISVVNDWLNYGEGLPAQHLESLRRAGAGKRDRKAPMQIESDIDTTWKCFVAAFEEAHSGGRGFLSVAKDINLEIPSSDDKYSQSLLIATRSRIQNRQTQKNYKMGQEEAQLLCSVLDVVRAIPYVVHGQEAKLKDEKVKELYFAIDMDIFRTPSVPVSESQIQLCGEGWALLCWNILATEQFAPVHLAAVRLLQVMLGGGNYDVQTTMLTDLTDKTKCGRELLGSSCRRIFRKAADELRSIRKNKSSNRDQDILTVAFHVLIVLTCSCQHQHRGMQDYIPNQYGHEDTYLLVPDIYEFTVEVEREVKYAVENDALDTLHHTFDSGSVYLMDMLELTFRLFSFLASGPNEANQLVIVSSGIVLVMNRIHSYSLFTDKSELVDLDTVDPGPEHTEPHWQLPSLIKCRLNYYTKELLLSLLEGSVDKTVVASICQSLDFSIYATHMRTMKSICENRTDTELRVSPAIRTSGWVRSQCFQFITIIEKLVSADLPRKAMLPLMPVLRQKPMMEWYRARLGQAEVVRNGQLESLYFEMPTRWLEPTAYAEMVDETTILMDEAFNSASSHVDRISAFVENAIQYIWTVDRDQRSVPSLFKLVLVPLRMLTGQWYLLILSLLINVVCLLSLGSADDSMAQPLFSTGSDGGISIQTTLSFENGFEFKNPSGIMYERWTQGEWWMTLLAPLHLLVSILSVVEFLIVKNPILSNVSSRATMLRRMRRLRNSKQAVGSGFEDFVVCTIHVKELPPPRTAWNLEGFTASKLKSALITYGEIGGITMWGRNSQQALVSFLQQDAVDRVTDTLVDIDAREWQTAGSVMLDKVSDIRVSATHAVAGVSQDVTRMVGAGSSSVKHGSARMPGLGNSRLVGNLNALGKEISESAEQEMTQRKARLLGEVDKKGIAGGVASITHMGTSLEQKAEEMMESGRLRWLSSASTREKVTYRHLNIAKISLEQATRCTGEFSEKLKIAAREYSEGTSESSSLSMKQRVNAVIAQATNLDTAIANVVALLTYDVNDREASGFVSTTSSDTLVSLKLGPKLLKVLCDLIFSILGTFSHPLFFSYHLFDLFNARAARIVLKSITTNLNRLATTLVLALLLMYFFAILGYLFFSDRHIADNVDNPGGPCSNLLTCFVSYTFAGFLQTGLMYWLKPPAFPEGQIETVGDILGDDGKRIMFEISFVLIMSIVVISIITGIIVDTFGELRVAQDNAARYRRSTCFITGIPFSLAPEEKKTSILQYVFLLMFLRKKKQLGVRPLEPLERMVADKIDVGDISWLPHGRDASSKDETLRLNDELTSAYGQQSPAHGSSRQLANLEEQLEALADAVERIEARQVSHSEQVSADDGGMEGAADAPGVPPSEAAQQRATSNAMTADAVDGV